MKDIKIPLPHLTPLQWSIFTASFLIMALSFLKAFHYIKNYSNCDQRARLIGARALEQHKDPYFYKWQAADGEYLLDPNDQEKRIINGVTTTPTTLALISPLNKLPYSKYKLVWGAISFLCVGGILLFTLKIKNIATNTFLLAFAILAFFFSSSIWLIHLERGQIYIFYTLTLSAIYYFTLSKNKYLPYLAGLILALSIYIRPTFAFLIFPILFLKHYKVALSFILLLPILGLLQYKLWPIWQRYALAMPYYTGEKNQLFNDYQRPPFPLSIETYDNLSKIKDDFFCGGIEPIFNKLSHLNIPYLGYTSLAFVTLFFIFCFLKIRKSTFVKTISPTSFGIILFLSYILPEIIMAAPRGAYNLVAYIFPILLLAGQKIHKPILILLIIGGLFMQSIPFYFAINYPLGELLLIISLFWFLFLQKKENSLA